MEKTVYTLEEKHVRIIRRANEAQMKTAEFQRFIGTIAAVRDMLNIPANALLSTDGRSFIVPQSPAVKPDATAE
jgi:hypothetical protein